MEFKVNEGKWDRILRLVLGFPLGVYGVYASSWIWGILGLVLIITGITGFCGLYSLVGISTCPKE